MTPKDFAILVRHMFIWSVHRGSACLPGNPELTAIQKIVCNLVSTIPLLWTFHLMRQVASHLYISQIYRSFSPFAWLFLFASAFITALSFPVDLL